MNELAKAVYLGCKVGATASLSLADHSRDEFDAAEEALEDLDLDGMILIVERHRESQSGLRRIELVRFERLI